VQKDDEKNVMKKIGKISNLNGNKLVSTPRRRVARWFVLKPKIPIRVNFVGPCNGRCWYILWLFGLSCGYFVYLLVIWYIFPVLVCCTKENLATLAKSWPMAENCEYIMYIRALIQTYLYVPEQG
jgi:hypothetical protein